MRKNIENCLKKIREYLDEYNRLANELSSHYNDKDYLRRLHLLEKQIIILKQNLSSYNLNEAQNHQKFLEHHFAAIQLANQHMHQLQLQLDYSFVNAELEELKSEMQKILEEIELEQQQFTDENISTFAPTPTPGGSQTNKDDE